MTYQFDFLEGTKFCIDMGNSEISIDIRNNE